MQGGSLAVWTQQWPYRKLETRVNIVTASSSVYCKTVGIYVHCLCRTMYIAGLSTHCILKQAHGAEYFLEKLIVAQLVNKFLAFCATRRIITFFQNVPLLILVL
jgi:hypothetical protein